MSRVWQAPLPTTEKMVLLVIADHADDNGDNAWPSVGRIAERASISTRHTQRVINQLVDLGWLEVTLQDGGTHRTRSDRRPNRYRVLDGATPTSPRDPERGDMGVVNGVTPMSPDPSIEPSITSSLRSEDNSDSKSQLTREGGDDVNGIVKGYWDQHAERTGMTPAATWVELRAVVKASLKRGCTETEIIDALHSIQRVKPTTALVIQAVGEARRRAQDAPATPAISQSAIVAYNALADEHRVRAERVGGPPLDSVIDRPTTLATFEILTRGGFAMEPREIAARCAIYWHHAGVHTPTVDQLIDRDMPFDRRGFDRNPSLEAVVQYAWRQGAFG